MRQNFINIKEKYVILFIYIGSLRGYPVGKNEIFDKAVSKEERHFPNGTVLGGYNFTDKEGNPVAVKYYADDNSYGVEFKSVKVSGFVPTKNKNIERLEKPELLDPDIEKDLEDRFRAEVPTATDTSMNLPKILENKSTSTNLDYEIFSQNVLSSPKKCNNEKVKVYYNSDKNRFARSSEREAEEITKFCEVFKFR